MKKFGFSPPADQRGGIALRIVLIGVTFLVVGGAIVWLLQNFQRNQETHQRKALHICEYGLQQALEKLSRSPSWQEGLSRTQTDGGWFEVRIDEETQGDSLLLAVESFGHSGSVTRKKKCLLLRVVSGNDTAWMPQYIE